MDEHTTPTPREPSAEAHTLHHRLRHFRDRFRAAADGYDRSTRQAAELEELMADYSILVTDEHHIELFAQLEHSRPAELATLTTELRTQSARCAAVTEKYRALRLIEGQTGTDGYFANVETCIDQEFGALAPTRESAVLLIGSGSFPMTLLTIAERTGASVTGLDIDPEAVELGRRVVKTLAGTPDITLECRPIEELPFTAEATHIVFSSTVETKYDLLERLHPITRDDVVVAMRFGDGLKSLFNYPRQDVNPEHWQQISTVHHPNQVFDVAVYTKPDHAGKAG
ncbi:Methyltransferase domain-containing protein [Austwickia chelonae]|uniref:Methyltransferase domain-containing protein n=1 Tax=Austwickia chelonae NBRC 105200 TaxID=1184607 RepID=K6VVB7_9MICO|nr:class I SAM-dependent methyltransferase [Austwickia chelonae]GAB79290.1 hypothetical protein AUCHE_22_00600 [Austwickia chelonae NBRC 105200]SEW37961.1 Methyltransferase domain-containing protein [Austwickia chelonae]